MSHDLKLLIAAELRQLSLLIEPRRSLIERSMLGPVSTEDVDALSALLHSAYTAMERVMTHIAKYEGNYDGLRSQSFMWHSALLNLLAAPTDNRSSIISEPLYARLKEYLGFRHVFRHAYLHELQWSKMHGLVQNLESVIIVFESEVTGYLEKKV